MKIILNILLTCSIFIFQKNIFKIFGGVLLVNKATSQTYSSAGNNGFNSWSVYLTNSPTNVYGNRYNCVNVNRDSTIFNTKYLMLDSLYYNNFTVNPSAKFLWVEGRRVKISNFTSFPLTSSQVTTALGFVPSAGTGGVNAFNSRTGSVTLLNTDVYSALGYTPVASNSTVMAGFGANVSGVAPSQTVTIDTTQIMYTSKANTALSNKTNKSTSLTINGTSFDLSANRSWTIPVSTLTSISAGSGISVTNGTTITNTSPDQIVSITQGANLTVSGSYPNFTLAATTQTSALTSGQVTTALGYTPLQTEIDGNVTNEIQTLSFASGSLNLSINGGSVAINSIPISNSQVTTALGYIPLQTEVDGNITNEIQTLSGSGTNTITLSSGGGSFVIPTTTTSYSGGTGISITGSIITNALPNITPTLIAGSNISITPVGESYTITSTNTLTSLSPSTGISVSGNTITNTIPDKTVTLSSSNLNITSAYPSFTLAIPSRTFNSSPGRTLSTTGTNNTFVISSTNDSRVYYTVNFSIALALITSNGVVSLDYSTDGGSTWITASDVTNAYTVAVTLAGNWDNILCGEIPAGARVRIYASTVSNCTITIKKQQEITY